MTLRSMFWDSVGHDRLYTSEDFAQTFNKLLTDGWLVGYADDFAVTDHGADLMLNVGLGAAWIQGRVFEIFGAPIALAFAAGDPVNPRIDRIVIQADYASRTATILVKQGLPAGVPVAPALTRVEGVTWELSLGRVAVAANATNINPANYTDEKTDDTLCGGVNIMGFPPSIEQLLDVSVGSITVGDTLVWDGTKFVPSLLNDPATTTINELLHSVGELGVKVWELEAKSLAQDNGMLDWQGEPFTPYINHVASRTVDGAGFPKLNIYRDVDIDQGFIGIDDLQVLARYKGPQMSTPANGVNGAYGMQLSPNKQWVVAVAGTTMRVYPVNADGTINNDTPIPTATTLPATAVNGAVEGCVKFTPDGKSIIVLLATTPFIVAYSFNSTTGLVGAAAANPAVLMAQAGTQMSINANSAFVAIAGGETASPFFTVYAYNSTTNVWGAKSAAPASPPAAATTGIAFDDAGTNLIIATSTPLLRAYAFNAGTGAIGANTDAAGTLTSLGSFVQKAGKVITKHGVSPFIRGYNFAAGVWSAQWAAPASLPGGPWSISPVISDDGMVIAGVNGIDGGASSTVGYALNAASFGAKIVPTNVSASYSGAQLLFPWPLEVQSDIGAYSPVSGLNFVVFGDTAGTTALTGQMQTATKTLPASCSQVYIADSFSKSSVNVTRQYDVSMDGGATWQNNIPVGQVVNVVPGTQLRVRLTMTRTALGQTGQIFWFNVWAG